MLEQHAFAGKSCEVWCRDRVVIAGVAVYIGRVWHINLIQPHVIHEQHQKVGRTICSCESNEEKGDHRGRKGCHE